MSWLSIPSAIRRAIMSGKVAREGLSAAEPVGALEALAKSQNLARGPKGELYHFPQDMMYKDRGQWQGLRAAIDAGIVDPAYVAATPSTKARSAARLADTVKGMALPKDKITPSEFEAVALRTDPNQEFAHSVAALSGPGTTHDPRSMYLYDLAAGETKGSGGELLRNILEGPLYPGASDVLFTPLVPAHDFYKNKFGAELLSPNEALTDPRIKSILDAVQMGHNAEDLGVGIIRRAKGGLATYKECNCGRT